MGDEFHQRNIAASALFAKEMAPLLARTDLDRSAIADVLQFLSDTDQFFLNLAMAACKSVMDAARTVEEGSVVTAMTRNGKDFGIRVSGLGRRVVHRPRQHPARALLHRLRQDQACPDIGDSSITETFGLGGMSMIAAPGVTRFVGAGGLSDALATSEEMAEIVVRAQPQPADPDLGLPRCPAGDRHPQGRRDVDHPDHQHRHRFAGARRRSDRRRHRAGATRVLRRSVGGTRSQVRRQRPPAAEDGHHRREQHGSRPARAPATDRCRSIRSTLQA